MRILSKEFFKLAHYWTSQKKMNCPLPRLQLRCQTRHTLPLSRPVFASAAYFLPSQLLVVRERFYVNVMSTALFFSSFIFASRRTCDSGIAWSTLDEELKSHATVLQLSTGLSGQADMIERVARWASWYVVTRSSHKNVYFQVFVAFLSVI